MMPSPASNEENKQDLQVALEQMCEEEEEESVTVLDDEVDYPEAFEDIDIETGKREADQSNKATGFFSPRLVTFVIAFFVVLALLATTLVLLSFYPHGGILFQQTQPPSPSLAPTTSTAQSPSPSQAPTRHHATNNLLPPTTTRRSCSQELQLTITCVSPGAICDTTSIPLNNNQSEEADSENLLLNYEIGIQTLTDNAWVLEQLIVQAGSLVHPTENLILPENRFVIPGREPLTLPWMIQLDELVGEKPLLQAIAILANQIGEECQLDTNTILTKTHR